MRSFTDIFIKKPVLALVVNLIILGEMIGIPLMNSVITLRLLPYVLGDLAEWKKRQLIEYEVLERAPEWH